MHSTIHLFGRGGWRISKPLTDGVPAGGDGGGATGGGASRVAPRTSSSTPAASSGRGRPTARLPLGIHCPGPPLAEPPRAAPFVCEGRAAGFAAEARRSAALSPRRLTMPTKGPYPPLSSPSTKAPDDARRVGDISKERLGARGRGEMRTRCAGVGRDSLFPPPPLVVFAGALSNCVGGGGWATASRPVSIHSFPPPLISRAADGQKKKDDGGRN